MSEPGLSACYEAARSTLEVLGVEWALIGALAAVEYRAERRDTTDVDFLIEPDDRLMKALQGAGFDVTAQHHPGGDAYFIRGRQQGVAAEFLVAETDYQFEALERAVDHVITAEDVIVHKLIAWRPRDQDDIRSILANPDVVLDDSYIERWAEEWEVLARWHEMRPRA